MANMRAAIVAILMFGFFTGLAECTFCQDTWIAFQNSCYLFGHNEMMSFYEAETFCSHHGGQLVHVNNAYENAFLKDQLKRYYTGNYWIGLTDERIEGFWLYTDTNTLATFTDWNHIEPNGDIKENCAEFKEHEDFQWNDTPCSKDNEPICEKTANSLEPDQTPGNPASDQAPNCLPPR